MIIWCKNNGELGLSGSSNFAYQDCSMLKKRNK